MNKTTKKFRRRLFIVVFVVLSTSLIIASSVWDFTTAPFYPPPPGTADYVASYFLGYLGLWERALVRAERARSAALSAAVGAGASSPPAARSPEDESEDENLGEEDENEVRRRLAAMNLRVATLHGNVGRYDEAAEVLEGEVLPHLRRRRTGGRRGGGGGAGPSEDAAAMSVAQAQVWELVMTDLSELYRRRGLYTEGLRVLAEAQEEYERSAKKSVAAAPTTSAGDRDDGGNGDGGGKKKAGRLQDALGRLTQSTLTKEHEIRGEEMRELAAALERNGQYVRLVEETAGRYDFSARTRWEVLPASKSEEEGETCPARQRCQTTTNRAAYLYAPSSALFATVVTLLLLFPVRRAWNRLFSPPPVTKFSRLRRLFALGNALGAVGAVVVYWNWSLQVDAVRYNTVGRTLGRLGGLVDSLGLVGLPVGDLARQTEEAALAALDAARCSLLSNPREETVLTTEVAAETFAAAAFVLDGIGTIGTGGSGTTTVLELADDLIGDVDDLLDAHELLGRPSFYVAGHYLRVGAMYFGRVERYGSGNNGDKAGDGAGGDGDVKGDGRGDGRGARSVVDRETLALWLKEGRRYRALAEAETRRLARYIEDMMEEEAERMSKEARAMGGKKGRNRTGLEADDYEEEEEEGEELSVRIDR